VAKFVTEEELDMVKALQDRLEVRLVVVEEQLASLTADVADLADSMNRRFDAVDQRFDAMDRRFDAFEQRLDKKIDDAQAALMSAILQLGRR
jgi:hypothetical protein